MHESNWPQNLESSLLAKLAFLWNMMLYLDERCKSKELIRRCKF